MEGARERERKNMCYPTEIGDGNSEYSLVLSRLVLVLSCLVLSCLGSFFCCPPSLHFTSLTHTVSFHPFSLSLSLYIAVFVGSQSEPRCLDMYIGTKVQRCILRRQSVLGISASVGAGRNRYNGSESWVGGLKGSNKVYHTTNETRAQREW